MTECELLKGCLFFNEIMPMEKGEGKMFITQYCKGDYSTCARYIVAKALGRENVPIDLYPDMVDRARKMIGSQ